MFLLHKKMGHYFTLYEGWDVYKYIIEGFLNKELIIFICNEC